MNFNAKVFVIALGWATQATPGFSTIPDTLKQKIDSLLVVANSSQGLQKYEAEFLIAYDLFDVDNHMAAAYAKSANEIATNEKDTARMVKSGRLCGQLLRRTGALDEAIAIFQKVLPLAERVDDQTETQRILNALSVAYNYQAKFDKAMRYMLKLLRIQRTLGDSAGVARSLNGVGVIYYILGNFDEAARYFESAIAIEATDIEASASINLALVGLHRGDVSSFEALYDRSLRTCRPAYRSDIALSSTYAKGYYFIKKGSYDSAETWFRVSLAKARTLGDARMEAENLLGIAQARTERGDLRTSMMWLRKFDEQKTGLEFNAIRMRFYDLKASVLEKSGRLQDALMYRAKHLVLKDSIYDQRVLNNLAIARVEFEERENELMISRQSEMISLNEKIINKQRWLILASISIGSLLGGLVFLLYRFARYQRLISRDLDRKVFERTKDLQESEGILARSLSEQRAMMELISRKVHASLATLRGLWHVRDMDALDQNTASEKFEATASELLQVSRIIDLNNSLRSGANSVLITDHSTQSNGMEELRAH